MLQTRNAAAESTLTLSFISISIEQSKAVKLHNILSDSDKSFFLLSLKKMTAASLGSHALQFYYFLLTYRIQDSVSLTAHPFTKNTTQTNYHHYQLNYTKSAFIQHDSMQALGMWHRSTQSATGKLTGSESSAVSQLSSKRVTLVNDETPTSI